jgi:hypothetical protein
LTHEAGEWLMRRCRACLFSALAAAGNTSVLAKRRLTNSFSPPVTSPRGSLHSRLGFALAGFAWYEAATRARGMSVGADQLGVSVTLESPLSVLSSGRPQALASPTASAQPRSGSLVNARLRLAVGVSSCRREPLRRVQHRTSPTIRHRSCATSPRMGGGSGASLSRMPVASCWHLLCYVSPGAHSHNTCASHPVPVPSPCGWACLRGREIGFPCKLK